MTRRKGANYIEPIKGNLSECCLLFLCRIDVHVRLLFMCVYVWSSQSKPDNPTWLSANHFSLPGALMAVHGGGKGGGGAHSNPSFKPSLSTVYMKRSICFFLSRSLHLHCSFHPIFSFVAPSLFSLHISACLAFLSYFMFYPFAILFIRNSTNL